MPSGDVSSKIARRAAEVGFAVSADLARKLSAYLNLLGRWNRRINLTALAVDPPDEEAIDRLVVEALAAVRFVLETDLRAIDIGSGGGSPAVPLKLAVPDLRYVLVEAKQRKAAFLREVVRELALENVEIESRRFEEFAQSSQEHEGADLVTLRAVRLDESILDAMSRVMRPGARLFWFATKEEGEVTPLAPLSRVGSEPLVPARNAYLSIARKTSGR